MIVSTSYVQRTPLLVDRPILCFSLFSTPKLKLTSGSSLPDVLLLTVKYRKVRRSLQCTLSVIVCDLVILA